MRYRIAIRAQGDYDLTVEYDAELPQEALRTAADNLDRWQQTHPDEFTKALGYLWMLITPEASHA